MLESSDECDDDDQGGAASRHDEGRGDVCMEDAEGVAKELADDGMEEDGSADGGSDRGGAANQDECRSGDSDEDGISNSADGGEGGDGVAAHGPECTY